MTVRAGGLADVRGLGGTGELSIAVQEPTIPEGQLLAEHERWRFAACSGGQAIVGELDSAADLVAAISERAVVVHDAKALGVVPAKLAHDTLLAAYLLEPSRRGFPLAELCEERGLVCDAADPLAAAAALTAALTAAQREQLDERGLMPLLTDVELPLVTVLRDMEVAGVRLNQERLAAIRVRVADEIAGLETDIHRLAGQEFTIGSPQQLGAVLFEQLGLSKKRRGKTGFSTDARVLQSIRHEHEIVPLIERWRELSQLMKTYLNVLPALVDGESRIHTTFIQAAATTGRLASTDPNMQNVPIRTDLGREIRGCFEAAPGNVLISADYSQVELRILAHVAKEPVLEQIFIRGEDVHTATASAVFEKAPEDLTAMDRSKAKMINYGIVYGLSDYGLADRSEHRARRGQGLHRRLPPALLAGGGVHGRDDRQGQGGGFRDDPVRAPAQHPGAPGAELPGPQPRRAPRRQHGHSGDRGGHHEARDDCGSSSVAGRGPRDARHPHHPR